MPLRGKAVAVTNQLQEMHERRERMEMMNYQQKMVNYELRQASVKVALLKKKEEIINKSNKTRLISTQLNLKNAASPISIIFKSVEIY